MFRLPLNRRAMAYRRWRRRGSAGMRRGPVGPRGSRSDWPDRGGSRWQRVPPLVRGRRPVDFGWLLAIVALVWASSLATQYVAARLGYHRNLGPWMFRAPEGAGGWLGFGELGSAAVALVLLLTSRRWAAVPAAAAAVSVWAARLGPIYAPTRLFVWYNAYHGLTAYSHVFQVAWAVFITSAVALGIAALRLLPRQPNEPV